MVINLLPQKEKREVRSIYRAHLAIAAMIVFCLLAIAAIVLIFAGLINLQQEKNSGTKALAGLSQQSQVVEFNKLRDRVNGLANYLGVVKANITKTVPPTQIFETVVLAAKPTNVKLTGLVYEVIKTDRVVSVTGVAASRQDLLAFISSLELLPQVKSVDSPVANLVSNINTEFTLTIILNPDLPHE